MKILISAILIFISLFLVLPTHATNNDYKKKINTFINNFEKNYKKDIVKKIKLTKIKNKLLKLEVSENYIDKKILLLKVIDIKIKEYNKKIKIQNFKRIAHAWGAYNWKTYTNSINALEENKNYYSLFEIDFSWTKDNKLVCIHDWQWSFYNTFWVKLNWDIPTYKEFFYYIEKNYEYKNCTLESLINWLKNNPEKYIITDIKNNNVDWLKYIATKFPNYIDRFIPQIYDPINYKEVKDIWYNKIIWTLYRYWESSDNIIIHLKKINLYALTMPEERVYNWLWNKIKKINSSIYTYTHTINSYNKFNELKNMWINNIYTDKLKK